MVTPRRMRSIVRQLETTRDRIGKERDKLRRLIEELETLEDPTTSGLEDLQNAIDRLSEQA